MAVDQPKTSKRLAIALGLSLSVNLLIVGMVAGAILAGGPPGSPDRSGARDGGLGSFGIFSKAMNEGEKRAVRKAMRENRGQFRNGRREAAQEVGRVIEALRADPFDPAALTQVFSAQQARAVDRVSLGQRVFLDGVSSMSLAERRDYADRLEAVARRGPARR